MSDDESKLQELIEKFKKDESFYKTAAYNEANCRLEFLDPLFKILNWDISNKQGNQPHLREVIVEKNSEGRRPDYTMQLHGRSKYHVEAKKPSVFIDYDNSCSFQARQYGWSSKHRIVLLTNFEYLLIYDATIMPNDFDESNVALLKKYHYTEYVAKADELKELLSKQSVYSGQYESILDKYFGKDTPQGMRIPVDQDFLKKINGWRLQLAEYLYNVKGHHIDQINDETQRFINQLIFLRICEDRNLPLYHNLKDTINDESTLIQQLEQLIKKADKSYNSGLFSGPSIIFDLKVDTIKKIVEELYYPKSPYVFSLISANLLGSIYEAFLVERLIITSSGAIELAAKDENLDKDIVSTPIEIVSYMTNKTVSKALAGLGINEMLRLHFSDIACGSGVFLLEVYEQIMNYCREWLINNDPSKLLTTDNGELKLPFNIKKNILLSCIYGIDIDPHAVEAAKFNLLLKLLEDENEPLLVGVQPILPDLSNNIVCGNSLVGSDNILVSSLSTEELTNINPLDWNNINLDIIIGNPPYVSTEHMKALLENKEVDVYKKKYVTSVGQFDKYFIFLERAIDKVQDGGFVCYIIPNKFSKIKAGKKLREKLTKDNYIVEFIDFGSTQLFKDKKKITYSSIVLIQKKKQEEFSYLKVKNLDEFWANIDSLNFIKFDSDVISGKPWGLTNSPTLFRIINNNHPKYQPLINIATPFNGIQTSAEKIYSFEKRDLISISDDYYQVNVGSKEYLIEKAILKEYFKPNKVAGNFKMGSYDIFKANKLLIFPYDGLGKLYTLNVMKKRFPETLKYLTAYYDELKPRQVDVTGVRDVPGATKDTWYQYGRDQGLTAFNNKKKIIVGILSKNPLYLYDENNLVIASGGTAGYCGIESKVNSQYSLEYLQAYLAHPRTDYILSLMASDFEGDYYARGTNVLNRIPIKILDFTNPSQKALHDEIVVKAQMVYKLNAVIENSSGLKRTTPLERRVSHLLDEIFELINEVYKI